MRSRARLTCWRKKALSITLISKRGTLFLIQSICFKCIKKIWKARKLPLKIEDKVMCGYILRFSVLKMTQKRALKKSAFCARVPRVRSFWKRISVIPAALVEKRAPLLVALTQALVFWLNVILWFDLCMYACSHTQFEFSRHSSYRPSAAHAVRPPRLPKQNKLQSFCGSIPVKVKLKYLKKLFLCVWTKEKYGKVHRSGKPLFSFCLKH